LWRILEFCRELSILAILDILRWIVSLALRSRLGWLLKVGSLYLLLVGIQMSFINLPIRLLLILIIVAAGVLLAAIIIGLILLLKATLHLLLFDQRLLSFKLLQLLLGLRLSELVERRRR
jgi:hypothetical protein